MQSIEVNHPCKPICKCLVSWSIPWSIGINTYFLCIKSVRIVMIKDSCEFRARWRNRWWHDLDSVDWAYYLQIHTSRYARSGHWRGLKHDPGWSCSIPTDFFYFSDAGPLPENVEITPWNDAALDSGILSSYKRDLVHWRTQLCGVTSVRAPVVLWWFTVIWFAWMNSESRIVKLWDLSKNGPMDGGKSKGAEKHQRRTSWHSPYEYPRFRADSIQLLQSDRR